jgi:putative tryptophan/tyrosine transport system substrate-binding protein
MIVRRAFLAGSLAVFAAPFAAEAQQAGKVPRVGVLSPGKSPPDDAFHQRDRFEAGLRELGWKPGSTILIDYRYAEGKLDRLPALAAELVRLPVEVIVARGLTIAAARQATAKIPIVMAADPDPVRSGFVVSLARPGRKHHRVQHASSGFGAQAARVVARSVAVVGTGGRPDERELPGSGRHEANRESGTNPATRRKRSSGQRFRQLAAAFEMVAKARADAVLVSPTLLFIDAKQLAGLALKHRQATIHNLRQFAEAGVLISYGASFAEIHRRVALYVDKLLKGANAAELSVEQPTKFEMVINLKTAKTLGLTIPRRRTIEHLCRRARRPLRNLEDAGPDQGPERLAIGDVKDPRARILLSSSNYHAQLRQASPECDLQCCAHANTNHRRRKMKSPSREVLRVPAKMMLKGDVQCAERK